MTSKWNKKEHKNYVIVEALWLGEVFCDGVSDFGDSLLTRDVCLALFVTVADVRFTLFRLLVGGGYSYKEFDQNDKLF